MINLGAEGERMATVYDLPAAGRAGYAGRHVAPSYRARWLMVAAMIAPAPLLTMFLH